MSTRAAIGYYTIAGAGEIKTIYCHYDGYPRHVGKILKEHYSTDKAVDELVRGCAIRNFDHDGTICRFPDGGVEFSDDMQDAIEGLDYLYLWDFDASKWSCYARDGFVNPDILTEIEL